MSSKVRKRFRTEKKIELARKAADAELKGRYGLPETLSLAVEDDSSRQEAKDEWSKAVKLRKTSSSSNPTLKARVLANTAKMTRK